MPSGEPGILSGSIIKDMVRRGEISLYGGCDLSSCIEISGLKLFADMDKGITARPGETIEIGVYPSLKLPERFGVTISPTTSEARRFNHMRAYSGEKIIAWNPLELYNDGISLKPRDKIRATVCPKAYPIEIIPGQHIANMRVVKDPLSDFFLDPLKDIENYLFGEGMETIKPEIHGNCFTMTVNTLKEVENGFVGYRAREGVKKAVQPIPYGNQWEDFLIGLGPGKTHKLENGCYIHQTSEILDITRGNGGRPFVTYMLPEGPWGMMVALAFDIHPENGNRQAVEIIPDQDCEIVHRGKICYILPCRLISYPNEWKDIRPQWGNETLRGKYYT